jgi:hypothetical protein
MPSPAQHARDFAKQTGKPREAVRGFDVDHRVEGLVGEGQILGAALHELQAGQIMSF